MKHLFVGTIALNESSQGFDSCCNYSCVAAIHLGNIQAACLGMITHSHGCHDVAEARTYMLMLKWYLQLVEQGLQ